MRRLLREMAAGASRRLHRNPEPALKRIEALYAIGVEGELLRMGKALIRFPKAAPFLLCTIREFEIRLALQNANSKAMAEIDEHGEKVVFGGRTFNDFKFTALEDGRLRFCPFGWVRGPQS